ncbi:MAG: hypothetical protein M3O34_15535 [Chloroflexota bacterium]|nr:hypothetical protein [Chloroflexota bacterium]
MAVRRGDRDTPALSVVAAIHSRKAGRRWLERARPQVAAAGAQIVLVGPGADPRWARGSEVVVEVAERAALTPELWARGIVRSRGQAVALTISECLPAAGWVPAILTALGDAAEAAAVGGVLELDPRGTPADWALYFLRYSAYMPPMRRGPAREVAADNAVYRRAALDRYPESWRAGFWEPSVHAQFHRDGLAIVLDPRVVVMHRHSLSPAAFSRQRFVHGRAFGAARFGAAPPTVRALRTLAAPVAGVVLGGRVAARVLARKRHRLRLLASAPFLAWFIACWIVGEATGYLLGSGRPAPMEAG